MKRLRDLLLEMSLLSDNTPDGAIVMERDGNLKTYSADEAASVRNNWLKEDLGES